MSVPSLFCWRVEPGFMGQAFEDHFQLVGQFGYRPWGRFRDVFMAFGFQRLNDGTQFLN